MNQENIMKRGRLAELEKKYAELDIATSSDVALARTLINPYEDQIVELKDQEIEIVVHRLCENIRSMRKIISQIHKIKEDLNLL